MNRRAWQCDTPPPPPRPLSSSTPRFPKKAKDSHAVSRFVINKWTWQKNDFWFHGKKDECFNFPFYYYFFFSRRAIRFHTPAKTCARKVSDKFMTGMESLAVSVQKPHMWSSRMSARFSVREKLENERGILCLLVDFLLFFEWLFFFSFKFC